MSELETKPEEKKVATAKPGMSLRSVATIAGAVLGVAGGVVLLAAGGWLAVAGGTVAVAGAGYTRHRLKNPRRPSGRRSTNGGKLTWPLTGNQSRRSLLRSGKPGQTRASKRTAGTGFRTGGLLRRGPGGSRSKGSKLSGKRSGLPLPKTTRSRARSSAGGVLPKHRASRPVSSTTSGRMTRKTSAGVAAKPKGIRAPKTPSRTPAKAGKASRLVGSSPQRKPGSPSSTRRATRRATRSRRPGNGSSALGRRSKTSPTKAGRKLSTPGRSSTSRRTGPSSSTQKGSPRKLFGRTGARLRRKTSPGGSPSTRANGRTRNPLKRTSPSGLHSRTRNPFKRTTATPGRRRGRTMSRARRLGTPDLSRTPNRSPSRSARRPRPFQKARARRLIRLAVGLPTRKGSKLKRVSPAVRRRARRTLWLRGRTRLWALRKLPGMFGRWHWDRIWTRVPQQPAPEWRVPTVPAAKAVAVPGPRHSVPAPSPTTTEVPAMSNYPHGAISEGFAMLAQFQPESASEMERFLANQHEMWTDIAGAYGLLADRAVSEMPFGSGSADSLRDLGAAAGGLAALAQDVHATFRQEHESELARIEAPRPNEQLWDTEKQ